jgi:outer membrane protein OmpA-like peptidoglycan-associated protein
MFNYNLKMIMKKVGLLLVFGLAIVSSSFSQNTKAFANGGFWDNWFIGAGAKGNVYINGHTADAELMSTPTLGGELYFGKWFTPVFGGRLTLEGGALHPFYTDDVIMGHQEYASGHLDLLFNATNFFCSYNPTRFYNFIPYLGIGYSHGFLDDWKKWENNSITFAGGILNTFRLSEKIGLYLDIRGLAVDDQFDGRVSGDFNWDGIASASLGLTYKFGSSGTAATRFEEVAACDQSLIDDLNDQINRLRAENAKLAKRPESCPDAVPCPPAPVAKAGDVVVPNVVFFRLNSANIDSNQQISIYNTAEYLKANPNAKVKVVGYADKQTGTADYNLKLSEKRAKNVAKALIEKYNIASDRVAVEWKGSSEQPYKENAWNRVAIFFAE